MNPMLEKIDPDKREQIINAAMKEFSGSGYDKASTNMIVQQAGISKGLLFHYFKNKETLYSCIKEYAMDFIIRTVQENVNWQEHDFFERVTTILHVKYSAMSRYPYIYDFLKITLQDVSIEEMLRNLPEESKDLMRKTFTQNIDFSLFKPDINIEHAMNIIYWSLSGLNNELWQKRNGPIDFSSVFTIYEDYIRTLQTLFYR